MIIKIKNIRINFDNVFSYRKLQGRGKNVNICFNDILGHEMIECYSEKEADDLIKQIDFILDQALDCFADIETWDYDI